MLITLIAQMRVCNSRARNSSKELTASFNQPALSNALGSTNSFAGEIKIARKHTRFIMRDLPGLVSGAVGQLGDRWHEQAERINAYREHELTDVQAHDLVIRALDNRAITVTQVPAILQEWRTPRHPEFAVDSRSAWRFFNAVTEAAKDSGLWTLPQRTQALHGLLDGEVGLFSQN